MPDPKHVPQNPDDDPGDWWTEPGQIQVGAILISYFSTQDKKSRKIKKNPIGFRAPEKEENDELQPERDQNEKQRSAAQDERIGSKPRTNSGARKGTKDKK